MIITKNDILEITEPFEEIYGDMSAQILILMAEYLGKDIDEPIEIWQQKRIQEIKLLLKQTQSILKKPNYLSITTVALGITVDKTLKDVEPTLKKAAKQGVLKKSVDYIQSTSINELKKSMKIDFLQTFNQMNNYMQQSVMKIFNKAIFNVVNQYNSNMARRMILDDTVRKIYEGQARQKALSNAIRLMSDESIPCFIDKKGKQWSAEAYANMYARTNVHKMSIETVDKRNKDYGNDLYIVDKHSGAREKCAPWQGKIISKDNRSGYVEDASGKKIKFYPQSTTTYGEPDGLFGINCSHNKVPFIPNVSFANIKPLTKEEIEENKRVYQESQKQRAIERSIRKSKTRAAMFEKIGDEENFKKEAFKIKQKQSKMREFISSTGRTRRYDREKVVGFDKSLSQKVRGVKDIDLKKGYEKAIKKGDISALVDFEIYEKISKQIDSKLVNTKTKDGIMITGYRTHFIDRVIGQYEDSKEPIKGMRKGVPINDVLDALKNPVSISERTTKDKKSRTYTTSKCKVTINPDTGNLIQTNPKGGKNK